MYIYIFPIYELPAPLQDRFPLTVPQGTNTPWSPAATLTSSTSTLNAASASWTKRLWWSSERWSCRTPRSRGWRRQGPGRGHFGGLRMIGVLKDILNGWSVWNMIAGWWFGCHFWKIFPFILGINHHPLIDEVIFFRGVVLAHQPVIDMSWMESHNICAWKA